MVWGTKVPQRGPEAEPWWSLEAKPPESRYIQTVYSCQTHFYADLWPSPSSTSPTPLSPQKNSSDLRESHDPTRTGHGGHVPTRGLRYCRKRRWKLVRCFICVFVSNVMSSFCDIDVGHLVTDAQHNSLVRRRVRDVTMR